MAKNYVQEGDTLSFVNNTVAIIDSGRPVAFGWYQMAVALVNIAIGAAGSVMLEGVFQFAKATGVISQGHQVWWDSVAGQVINAPALGAYFLGFASDAALSDDASVNVKLEEFVDEPTRILTLAATGTETITAQDMFSGELVLQVPNTAAKTINLPPVASVPVGQQLAVHKTDAAAQAITLDANGTELIAGAVTYAAIKALNDYAIFINTGTAWMLIDSQIAP